MADNVELNQDSENKTENENIEFEKEEQEKQEKQQGCQHYKCRCAYISPCCGKEYVCRVCHDDAENHEINRFLVTHIVCLLCKHKQLVNRNCEECGIEFGAYFCAVCRMFDDNDKKQFHCDKCGICRVGGRENFFHCDKCDICLDNSLKDSHTCIEKVSRDNCPVCYDDLHSSRKQLAVFPCGHICHKKCRNGLLTTGHYSCPLCCQSIGDMKAWWAEMDKEIENTPMPEEYIHVKHWILCRDCHQVSQTAFHVLGLKCLPCGSYNTCRSANPNLPQPTNSTKPAPNN